MKSFFSHWYRVPLASIKKVNLYFIFFNKNNKKNPPGKKWWAISESFLSYPSVAGDLVNYSKIGLKFLNYWNLCNPRNLMRYGVQKPVFFCLLVSSNKINSMNWCSTWTNEHFCKRKTQHFVPCSFHDYKSDSNLHSQPKLVVDTVSNTSAHCLLWSFEFRAKKNCFFLRWQFGISLCNRT